MHDANVSLHHPALPFKIRSRQSAEFYVSHRVFPSAITLAQCIDFPYGGIEGIGWAMIALTQQSLKLAVRRYGCKAKEAADLIAHHRGEEFKRSTFRDFVSRVRTH
jgi:hypothetical protein